MAAIGRPLGLVGGTDPAAWPSPNHGARRGQRVALVVLHATNMASFDAARARLCDPAAEVSAHWLIAEDGTTLALVPEDRRAWHAGAGSWLGKADVNARSVGIELASPMDRPFPAPQMAALEALLADILTRHGLPPQAVIAHSDMAPQRKDDPGARFDWARLARMGLALGVTPAEVAAAPDLPLAASLTALGYPDAPPEALLAAFRLRHRPHATGPEAPADRRHAAALAYRISAAKSG